MIPDRTELEWTYSPSDFFEAPYQIKVGEIDLVVEGGKAVAVMTAPSDSVPKDFEERARILLESIFLIRRLQMRTKYKLEGPTAYQYSSGRKNVSIRVGTGSIALMGGQVDFLLKDAAGNVVRDSKAERIAEHSSLLDELSPKVPYSATLRSLLESYSQSIDDPNDELVHLYEIRDALSHHYGNERTARDVLAISKTEWQRLGILANVEPLKEGRHRGKHSHGKRPATSSELEEARSLVRRWIIAFAQTI